MEQAIERVETHDIELARKPDEILSQAQEAAKALKGVISNKPKKVIIDGNEYLEFEDWQTVGRFYGVTAKAVSTELIQIGEVQGFNAKAVALRSDGMEISGAEAMCLNDEANWKGKPLFQLKSMAQTRACAKALRNVLAWVVVLAGYKPTPAEEMDNLKDKKESDDLPPITPSEKKSTQPNKTYRIREIGKEKISQTSKKPYHDVFTTDDKRLWVDARDIQLLKLLGDACEGNKEISVLLAKNNRIENAEFVIQREEG